MGIMRDWDLIEFVQFPGMVKNRRNFKWIRNVRQNKS